MARKKTKEEEKSLRIEIIKQMLVLATSGFGLVAALAWNNLIQQFSNTYLKRWFKDEGELFSLFLYAILVTFVAVLVTIQLSRVLKQLETEKKS